MNRILVIDDLRQFSAFDAEYARNSHEGRRALESHEELDELWLDHDLGDGDDIRPLVLWMAELAHNATPLNIARVAIVSRNPVGAAWIEQTLAPYYEVRRVDPLEYGCTQIEG